MPRKKKSKAREQNRATYPIEFRSRVVREVAERKQSPQRVAELFGIALTTVKEWVLRYEARGLDGLVPLPSATDLAKERARSRKASASGAVRQSVIAEKRAHPEAGTRRISDLLARFPAVGVSDAGAADPARGRLDERGTRARGAGGEAAALVRAPRTTSDRATRPMKCSGRSSSRSMATGSRATA